MNGYIVSKEMFSKQKIEDIINILKREFIGGEPPINAWKNLIEDVRKSKIFKELPNDIILGFECACPTGGMSIDLLIAFIDKNNQKNALIIEAKNWSDDYIKTLTFSDNRRHDNSLHPQVQVHRQTMSFQGYTDIGEQYSVTPYVYIKCSQSGIAEIIAKNPDQDCSHIEVTNNIDVILSKVKNSVKDYNDEFKKLEIFSELKNASYKPSKGVIQAMHNLILNEPAFILTEEQNSVLNNVLENIKKGKKIIRIKGSAGTGKTAILIQLYLELSKQANNKIRPILVTGVYNTDYYRSLSPHSRDIFEFSHALNFIIKKDDSYNYVVLMDEAQHNDRGEISKIIMTNATLVVCYDEGQAIRAVNCLDELKQLEYRSDFVSIQLAESMRYNGSKVAEQNIRNYLQGKPIVKDGLFDFQICNNLQNFQTKLKDIIYNNPNSTVATVGLLCKDTDKYTYRNNQSSILYTRWGEKAECDYMEYVTSKNYLQKATDKIWVGTWWMQGLDVDYVAVIVGDDVILTDDDITIDWHKSALYQTIISVAEKMDLPKNLKNKEAKLFAKNIINYIDNADAQTKLEFEIMFTELVKNFYYIMLTRGRKGCLVYFANNTRRK